MAENVTVLLLNAVWINWEMYDWLCQFCSGMHLSSGFVHQGRQLRLEGDYFDVRIKKRTKLVSLWVNLFFCMLTVLFDWSYLSLYFVFWIMHLVIHFHLCVVFSCLFFLVVNSIFYLTYQKFSLKSAGNPSWFHFCRFTSWHLFALLNRTKWGFRHCLCWFWSFRCGSADWLISNGMYSGSLTWWCLIGDSSCLVWLGKWIATWCTNAAIYGDD